MNKEPSRPTITPEEYEKYLLDRGWTNNGSLYYGWRHPQANNGYTMAAAFLTQEVIEKQVIMLASGKLGVCPACKQHSLPKVTGVECAVQCSNIMCNAVVEKKEDGGWRLETEV